MTFLWKRGIVFREIVTNTKNSFVCILLKHRYTPHFSKLLLAPDKFVIPMMTCL